MKISVLTLHNIYNYGSVLQSYATQKFFKNLNVDVEFVDYIRPTDCYQYVRNNLGKNLATRIPLVNRSPIVSKAIMPIINRARINSYNDKRSLFSDFIGQHLSTTDCSFYSAKDLMEQCPEADAYCIGSDQVWNTVYNDGINSVYFLEWVPEHSLRFSFSSSIGMSELNQKEKQYFNEVLSKFKCVTVREKTAENLLKECGIYAHRILDPTLLCTTDEWTQLADSNAYQRKYILSYMLSPTHEMEAYVKAVSKALHIPVIQIAFEQYHRFKYGLVVINPPVQNFLSLFMNASYVITNSFHGTAFSIVFNKPFVSLLRDRFNSRIEDTLSLFRLNERIARDMNDTLLIMRDIPFSEVNQILKEERERAITIIKPFLNSFCS